MNTGSSDKGAWSWIRRLVEGREAERRNWDDASVSFRLKNPTHVVAISWVCALVFGAASLGLLFDRITVGTVLVSASLALVSLTMARSGSVPRLSISRERLGVRNTYSGWVLDRFQVARVSVKDTRLFVEVVCGRRRKVLVASLSPVDVLLRSTRVEATREQILAWLHRSPVD